MKRVLAVLLALVGALLPGCAASAGPTWREVPLPAGVRVAALVADASGLVVGTARPDARPGLLRVTPDATAAIDVVPTSPYAASAAWLQLASGPAGLSAVGGARGGAHGNVRWTVWRSATVGGREALSEEPQPFEAFGGEDAGALTGIADAGGGPLVVGSWRGAVGLDVALWQPAGDAWARWTPPGLASDAATIRSAAAIAVGAGGYVIVGNEIALTAPAAQSPMAWTARAASGPWVATRLPGGAGRASAVGCSSDARPVVGQTPDDRARAWWLTGGVATELVLPPETLGAGRVPAPIVLGGLGWLVLPTSDGTAVVSVGAGGPRLAVPPVGVAIAAASVGGRLYVATRDAIGATRLWAR
jgi:hypothetical protein